MEGRKKLKKIAESGKKYWVEYATKSSIHGFRYLTEPSRSKVEKTFWAIVLIVSLIVCSRIISDIWIKYRDSPVMMSIDEEAIPYWEIPFPAFTICSEAKSSTDYYSIEEFLNPFVDEINGKIQANLSELTADERTHLVAFSQICHNLNFTGIDPRNDTECSECYKVFKDVGIIRREMLNKCFFNTPCLEFFDETVTDEGYCFTFNSLKMEDIFRMENIDENYTLLKHSRTSQWSLEEGYRPDAPMDTYPMRAIPLGKFEDLSVNIIMNYRDNQPLCRDSLEFKFALHAPNEIPQMTKYFQKLALNHEVIITVSPQMMTTDENLRSFSPVYRQCFFNDERYLRYFKEYTQQNCKLECLTNLTLKNCGCVDFYMPRGSNVKVCGIGEIECVRKIRSTVVLDHGEVQHYNPTQCNCWPACISLIYNSKTSQVETKHFYNFGVVQETEFTYLTILNKRENIFATKKYEIYTLVDLISQFGGLLGLFWGVSLLSIVELGYYCFLRLPCTMRLAIDPLHPSEDHSSAQNLTCKGVCVDYSDNSSIHGFLYLTERNRSVLEKMFWASVIVVSFFVCGLLIKDQYRQWSDSPMIISTSKKAMPIWKIPFPAVTICPAAKSDSNLFNLYDTLFPYTMRHIHANQFDDLPDGEVRSNIIALSQVCLKNFFTVLAGGRPSNCSDCLTSLRRIALKKESIFKTCKYHTFAGDVCKSFFYEIVTDEGICYTFNTLKMTDIFRDETIFGDYQFLNHTHSSKQWSSEDGYTPNATLHTYPLRALGIGPKMGVTVDMSIDYKHYDHICILKNTPSYKMVLHAPDEVPQVSIFFKKLPIENEVIATIQPRLMTTDENLRSYSPKIRRCFFNDERHLRYFKIYNLQNCWTECLTNYTLRYCGCVRIHMPRHKGVSICALNDLDCSGNAATDLRNEIIKQERKNAYNPGECNCWPACTSITYEVEINQVNLNWNYSKVEPKGDEKFSHEKARNLHRNRRTEITRVTLLFKREQFFASIRSELFGLTDLSANCGGLLGLFLGVSLLSIVEIVYYFSIRLACSIRKRHIRS